MPSLDALQALAATVTAGGLGVLVTGLLLGIRHGFDWDHIAAITDITSTTATADAPRPDTQKISAIANTDSIAISSIIGMASRNTALSMLPFV